jgi:hypothetical protein
VVHYASGSAVHRIRPERIVAVQVVEDVKSFGRETNKLGCPGCRWHSQASRADSQ